MGSVPQPELFGAFEEADVLVFPTLADGFGMVVTEAFSRGLPVIATNVTLWNPPAVIHSLTEYKQGMTAFHTAFPDLQFTTEDEIAEGNKIAVRWTLRATNLGEYQGHPPTSKTITVTGISIFQIANGKIQDIRMNMDRLGQFQTISS